jgi:hypothetical protein
VTEKAATSIDVVADSFVASDPSHTGVPTPVKPATSVNASEARKTAKPSEPPATFDETIRFNGTPGRFGGYDFHTLEPFFASNVSTFHNFDSLLAAAQQLSFAPIDPFGPPVSANGARLVLHEKSDASTSSIAFVDAADVTTDGLPPLPQDHTFIGVWRLEAGSDFESADLMIRYDDLLMGRLGLNESLVKLWTTDGTDWIAHTLDASFGRDTNRNLVWASTGHFTSFAVSTPEPATLLVPMAACALVLRRRAELR